MNDVAMKEERRRTLAPAAQVREESGVVQVRIEMPGVGKNDLEIHVEGRELTVVGRRQEPATDGTWLLRERPRGDFQKTYAVDGSIDLDKVDATLSNGLLTLTLPVKDAAKPRRIDIR